MEVKERRIVFDLKLQADTLKDLSGALYQLSIDIDAKKGVECASTMASGGCHSGYKGQIRINHEMDGDKYRDWLEEYRQSKSLTP